MLVENLELPMTQGELEQAMIEMDEDGSGQVDFEEFAAWWPTAEEKFEELKIAMNGRLEALEQPVQYEDAEMTVTIVPPAPKGRGKRAVASQGSQSSSSVGSRDYVLGWDPPDVDVQLRGPEMQGRYMEPAERVAARRVMLEWQGTINNASRFVEEIMPLKVAYDKADKIAKRARKIAEKAERVLEKHCAEAATMKAREMQRMLIDRETTRLTVKRTRAMATTHALHAARKEQARARRRCLALEHVEPWLVALGQVDEEDLTSMRHDARSEEAYALLFIQDADPSYSTIKSTTMRRSGGLDYVQNPENKLVVPDGLMRDLEQEAHDAAAKFHDIIEGHEAVKQAKLDLAVVQEKLRILDELCTRRPSETALSRLRNSVQHAMEVERNTADGVLSELAERCATARIDVETASGSLQVLERLGQGAGAEQDRAELGTARVQFLKAAQDAAVLAASEQGATLAKTRVCRELHRTIGKMVTVFQLQAMLRTSPPREYVHITDRMDSIVRAAKEDEAVARDVRGNNQRIAVDADVISKLHCDNDVLTGGLQALETVSHERETRPAELMQRGHETSFSIMQGMEAPRQAVLLLKEQHRQQLGRMHAEMTSIQMRVDILSAAVNLLREHKDAVDQRLKEAIEPCIKKGSMYLELWDPQIQIDAEHFNEVWVTAEAGRVTWYRTPKRTEVDYEANLTGAEIMCAYNIDGEGPGGGREKRPKPLTDAEEGDGDEEKEGGDAGEEEPEEEEEEEDSLNLRFTFHMHIDNTLNPPVVRKLNSRQDGLGGIVLTTPGSRPYVPCHVR